MSEQVIYAKACMERKPEYRQQTLIIRRDGKLLVRKVPVGAEAAAHISTYAGNREILAGALRAEARVSAVPCTLNEDGSVDFPFLADPTLQDRLAGRPAGEYAALVIQYRDALTEAFGEEPFIPTDGFTAFFGYVRVPEGLTALKVTNADMTFDNVFCGEDGTYTFIDYEWILPFPVPLAYLIYRALPQDPAYTAFTEAEQETVLAALGITGEMKAAFGQMEEAFLENISPDEYKLDSFLRIPGKRQTVVVPLEELLAGNEAKSEYDRYSRRSWYRLGRKAERGARKLRDRARSFARRDNFGGHCCSAAAVLCREGPTAAWEKVILPQKGKRALKRYGRRLSRSADQPAGSGRPEAQAAVQFSILVPLYNTPTSFLEEMIRSVQAQTCPDWELCLADGSGADHPEVGELCERLAAEDPRIRYRKLEENLGISGNTNVCIDMATGEYLALLDHDDLLHPEALAEAARAIREEGADFIYTDEAVFRSPDRANLIAAYFKPDWSPEKLLTNNYICHFTVFKASLLEQAGCFRGICDGSQDYDLILRLTDCAEKVVHIPKARYFWRSHAASTASDISAKSFAVEAGKTALKDFLRTRKGMEVMVESAPEYPTLYHVKYPLKDAYTVTLVMDLVGKTGEEIRDNLTRIWQNTAWRQVSLAVLADSEPAENPVPWPVKWITNQGGNRPERLNAAAKDAERDFLVFLEAGVIPENRGWLHELVMLAQQEAAGAVGGKIFFEDGRLRHGGLILGLGWERLAGRACFRIDGRLDGYFGQLSVVQNVSAVSAECMAVSRAKFEACGGFDPAYAGTLYDADLCLKLRDLGYRNLFTPFALCRGGNAKCLSPDYGAECGTYRRDAKVFRTKWKQDLEKPDPYYNPNLTRDRTNYAVGKQAARE